jgi:hypothetical protein
VGISPSGPGSSTYSESQLERVFSAFRADLRLLVSTSILEEGIDVPECDAVVDFDVVTSTRQGQQRKGRARAQNASYAVLGSSDTALEKRQQNEHVRLMQEMTVAVIAPCEQRPDRPDPPDLPSPEQARANIEPKSIRTYHPDGRPCALLPIERCKKLLDDVYCITKFAVQPGDSVFELDLTHDGTHFTAKHKKANNFNVESTADGHTCKLHLPGVRMCSADIGNNLPITLPWTKGSSVVKKQDAIDHAALEGVNYLLKIGVLDMHLQVSAAAASLLSLAVITCM